MAISLWLLAINENKMPKAKGQRLKAQKSMITSAIAAYSKNRCIGKNKDIPWSVPADMKYFMNTTRDHHIISGRINFEAMGLLKRRTNIIVTRNENYRAQGAVVVHSIQEGIELARFNGESETFVIGGGQIYKMALELDLIDRLYITELDLEVDNCEVYFPEFDLAKWELKSEREGVLDERNTIAQTYFVYERKK